MGTASLTFPDHDAGDHAEDIADAFADYFVSRDWSLRNRLVEQHLHLAEVHVRRYCSATVQRDDVRQVARLAILGAVERFDPGRGITFATFAARTVEGECRRYLRDRTWGVRPPRRLQEVWLASDAAAGQLTQELGRAPAIVEIAERIGVDARTVRAALEAGRARHPVDLMTTVVADQVGATYELVEFRVMLAAALPTLADRDLRILDLRFNQGWTECRIAAEVGLSQGQLSRNLRRILRQLRGLLDDDI